ncbi:helix-turn-helix domain-containing protein [Lactobacillus helveticus]|uniref:helix-turn-helix domain-containing protein n=1 Tax=Lactobacillus helveticus TaxID=1587 RepID=UPI0015626DEF|nr:helix-turn-helix transcriptional regulator [Lactobacillus helveticus]NRO09126.1 hypothetical protein [Lactobacillus helveticus]
MQSELFLKCLGLIILQKRSIAGISQEKLGELASLHRTYISDVERGSKNLTINTLIKISNALNVSPSELLSLTERKYSNESRS